MFSSIREWIHKITTTEPTEESLRTDVLGVEEALQDVEQSLGSIQSWDAPRASEVVNHLVEAGGKRLRPALVFLTFQASGGADREAARPYAVAAELLHTATLLHDDVLDESEKRRGRSAAKVKYGNRQAILGGDFLVAKIVEDLLERDYVEVARYLGFTMRRLVQGEFLQEEYAGRFDLSEEQYFQVVELKTAALFAYAAWAGSYLPREDESFSNSFARYAESLGIAFQLVDDVLDFHSDSTGKEALDDLEKGNINYPLIQFLDRKPQLRRRVSEEFHDGGLSSETKERVFDGVRESAVLDESRRKAREYTSRARAALEEVDDNARTELLRKIPEFVTERMS